MRGLDARRLALIAGWLLTPVVAWAVSFLGGWLGAIVGARAGARAGGIAWLVSGAVVGAVTGVAAWVWIMRVISRRVVPSGSPDSGVDEQREFL